MSRQRHLRAAIAIVFLLGVTAAPASAQDLVERPEEELLLLALRAPGVRLAEALPAWPTPGGGVMLPLGEVARLLTIAIEVDVMRGVAEGFIIREDRTFLLEARRGRIVIAGRETRIETRLVEVQRDDIYVDAALLQSWIPVDLNVDLRQSLVNAVPREPLPFMQAREREAKLQRASRAGPARERHPEQPLTWSPADGVAFEHQSRLTSAGGDVPTRSDYWQSTFLAGDLARHNVQLWLVGNDDDLLDEIRATIGRRHPEPVLLGGLRAREYAIGEVFVPADDILMVGGSGPGMLLSNVPLRRTNEFDAYTIQGIGPAGWDVELYQNDALIAMSRVGLDGRYEFPDVPIYFGLNVFRLVFYGPQGQIREETQRLEIAESLAKPGELTWRLAAADVRGRGERGELEIDWGSGERSSIRIALGGGDFLTGRDSYLRAGVGAYQGTWYGRIDGAVSEEGGTLVRAALQTRLAGLSVTGELAWLDGFKSEVYRPQFGLMRSRARGRVDGILPPSLLSINFSLDASRESFEGGGELWTIGNRLSKQFGRTFVTHTMTSRIPSGLGTGFENVTSGSLIGSRFSHGWSLRGEIAWQLEPDARIDTATIQLDSYRARDYQFGVGVQHIRPDDSSRAFASIARTRGTFGWSASVSWDDRHRWTATAGLGISGIRDPLSGSWETSARSLATQGAASLRVFVDRDLDGVFSEGDEPLKGVGFVVNRAVSRVTSDANGLALVSSLPADSVHEVSISASTLEDLLMRPATPGVSFYVRLGVPTIVELPVIMTGEIYGTVTVEFEGRSRAGGGLTVELVAGDGTVEATSTVAYDGFYELTGVRPGSYFLRLGERARGRTIERPEPVRVVIPPDGAILDGIDLVARE